MMRLRLVFLCLCLSLLLVAPTLAQSISVHVQPELIVDDQVVRDGHVLVQKVVSDGPGWVVIYAENTEQVRVTYEVIGWAHVDFGLTNNLLVPINDGKTTTSTLIAVLHKDDGQSGVYEYDGKSGIDNPVSFNGVEVSQAFNIDLIDVPDQFAYEDHQVAVKTVVAQAAGGVGVYAYTNGKCGAPLAWLAVNAGTTPDFVIPLTASTQYTMMCVSEEDSSGVPVVMGGQTATTVIRDEASLRLLYQDILAGNGRPPLPPVFNIYQVNSKGPGVIDFTTIVNGAPGNVVATLPVPDGVSYNLPFAFTPDEAAQLTPTLLVTLNDGQGKPQGPLHVAQFVVPIAPSILAADQTPTVGTAPGTEIIMAATVLIDQPGILGAFDNKGVLLGETPVHPGDNPNVAIAINVTHPTLLDNVTLQLFYIDALTYEYYEYGQWMEGLSAPPTA